MIQNPFRTFKNSAYLFYWAFNTFSLLGTWIDFTLRQWIIVEMIKNERAATQYVGFYNLVRFIPSLFLSFIAGYLSDRIGARLILFFVSLIDFFNACAISYLVYTNNLNVYNFMILALFLGITNSFYFPSRSKLINSIVQDKEDIPSSFSWQGISFNLSRIIGPVVAGMIAKNFGLALGFLLNAISYIPLIFYLLFLNDKVENNSFEDKRNVFTSIFEDFKNTISYVSYRVKLKKCFYSIFTINFWGISLMSFLQVFTKEILNENINYFSYLLSMLGLGAVIGAFFVASTNYQVILNTREEIFIIIYGICILLLTLLPKFSFFIMFLIGFSQSLVFGFTNNKVQLLTDNDMIGKVSGIYSLFNITLSYLGVFVISQVGYLFGVLNLFKIVAFIVIFSAFMIGIKVKEG